ncbi:MAG TPA: hypothetical protein VNG33_08845, partial [Polyangiaceae bacterium]|nr:hypothetical protein [Polyangiaceae bacterium]
MTALPASAQTDEQRAGARSLATEGVSAFNEGRFSDAAELFEKAESLVHAPTHLLFLARSDAKLGRYVKAREAYLKIVKEQLPSTAPQAFRDAQTAADTEVRAIEPKIARLKVKLEGGQGATDLTLKIDGDVLSAVLIGASQPLDPGEHTVEILARGKSAAPQKVTLTEGGAAVVTLKLVDDPNAAPVPVAAPGAAAPGAPPADGAPPSDAGVAKPGQGLRIASYSA